MKKRAAERIRACLEARIANVLDCKPSELPYLKLGSLLHFVFLLKGSSEDLGGFSTSIHALLDMLGPELVWDLETKEEEAPTPKEIIN
jgi:hypothetical protein